MNPDNTYNYAYVNGEVREKDPEADVARREKQLRIFELKRLLSVTDYKAIKYAEGILTAEEYEETKQQRQAWRDEINSLQEEILNY